MAIYSYMWLLSPSTAIYGLYGHTCDYIWLCKAIYTWKYVFGVSGLLFWVYGLVFLVYGLVFSVSGLGQKHNPWDTTHRCCKCTIWTWLYNILSVGFVSLLECSLSKPMNTFTLIGSQKELQILGGLPHYLLEFLGWGSSLGLCVVT